MKAGLVAVMLMGSSLMAQKPVGVEKAMVAAVDKEAPSQVEYLRELVEINSGTMNLDGVRAVRMKLAPRFEALGFKVHTSDMSAVGRAETLIAEHPCPTKGACCKRMLLIGHMDTVFDKASPFQHWTQKGDIAEGPGTNDMKGGIVVMLMALDAMQAAGVLKNADITVVLSSDEEAHGNPTEISRKDMIEAAKHADAVLEFEAVPKIDGVYYGSVSRRSSTGWDLKTTGKGGHSAGVFGKTSGYGAIYELARILDAFQMELQEPSLTFNVGTIAGGSRVEKGSEAGQLLSAGKSNIIPAVAEAQGDMRTISDEQTERVRAKMRAIVAEHLPKTDATITFHDGYPAMPPTEESRALLKILNEVNATLGVAPMPEMDAAGRGAGDISFVAKYAPGIAGVGSSGNGSHAPGETVDLPSQVLNAKRDALLMYRLSLQK